MTDPLRRAWAVIDLQALDRNVSAVRSLLRPECRIMAVVKADAYGHGDRRCAAVMERAGADWFGVSNLDEALALREAGVERPILILGYTPPECAAALGERRITQTVFSPEYAAALEAAAARAGVAIDTHIKIDTGMGRIGFNAFSDDCAAQIAAAAALPHLRCDGAFTHFASADEGTPDGDDYTRAQYRRFTQILRRLEERGTRFRIRHCCNSAATLRFPEMHLDMVRPGLILYGLYPDDCCRPRAALRPVMQLKSVVSMVKDLPAGRCVSYGRTFETPETRRIATVAIGYADGYRRALSNCGEMLVRGRRARVAGRVCMDQLMLDVTGIEGVAPGDEVTVFGRDGRETIPVEEVAALAGSFSYETVCLLSKRVPRVYE